MSTGQRREAIRKWEACPHGVLLLSTKAGGTGLTLTYACNMVSVDALSDPNPAVLQQVEGRVYRIGQERMVTLVRLASAGTVDEAVGGEVHSAKTALADLMLSHKAATAAKEEPHWRKPREASGTTRTSTVPSLYRSIMAVWKAHCAKQQKEKERQEEQQLQKERHGAGRSSQGSAR